jgi:hypothetical protein
VQQGYVCTTAGDLEQERFSPKANFVEGMGLMIFILVFLWLIAYAFGVMQEIKGAKLLSEILMVGGALYMLFVAPFLHKDTAANWGLGTPWGLWRLLKESTPAKRALLLVIVVALFIGLNALNIYHWEKVLKFLNLHRTGMIAWKGGFPGVIGMVTFGSILSLLIITFGIRYDNFLTAFRTAMIISLPLFVLIILAAMAQRGMAAFEGISISAFLIGIFGYVFWGFVQQLLFSSYLGTRIRKGFAPSTSPSNAIDPENRLRFTLVSAFLAAFLTAAGLFMLLRRSHGAAIPDWTFFAFGAFFLPLFAAYAWFLPLTESDCWWPPSAVPVSG